MKTYKIIIDGRQQGTVTTKDIEGYLKTTFPNLAYRLNSHEVHITLSWMDALRLATSKDQSGGQGDE